MGFNSTQKNRTAYICIMYTVYIIHCIMKTTIIFTSATSRLTNRYVYCIMHLTYKHTENFDNHRPPNRIHPLLIDSHYCSLYFLGTPFKFCHFQCECIADIWSNFVHKHSATNIVVVWWLVSPISPPHNFDDAI